MAKETRQESRQRRHERVRRKVVGSADRPRLNVYRSINHIYAQVIDDAAGHTIVSASSLDKGLRGELEGLAPQERAKAVGKAVAERARRRGSSRSCLIAAAIPIMVWSKLWRTARVKAVSLSRRRFQSSMGRSNNATT